MNTKLRVLFVHNSMHHKNLHAIKNYKNIEFVYTDISDFHKYNMNAFDCVYSPALPINVSIYPSTLYPNTKFMFGPHFSVFPDERLSMCKGAKTVYILPSEWPIQWWNSFPICSNINFKSLPFGLDVERFCPLPNSLTSPTTNHNSVFIYFKGRWPSDLAYITNYLTEFDIPFRVFSYSSRYSEEEYLAYLKQSKYGIWVDAHESQGFALEEALSCNVPLLVWSVSSLNQEYGANYPDVPATTIPYWDERCGEVFYKQSEFPKAFTQFLEKLDTYKPREYILENLTMDICEQRMIDLIKNI